MCCGDIGLGSMALGLGPPRLRFVGDDGTFSSSKASVPPSIFPIFTMRTLLLSSCWSLRYSVLFAGGAANFTD